MVRSAFLRAFLFACLLRVAALIAMAWLLMADKNVVGSGIRIFSPCLRMTSVDRQADCILFSFL